MKKYVPFINLIVSTKELLVMEKENYFSRLK